MTLYLFIIIIIIIIIVTKCYLKPYKCLQINKLDWDTSNLITVCKQIITIKLEESLNYIIVHKQLVLDRNI